MYSEISSEALTVLDKVLNEVDHLVYELAEGIAKERIPISEREPNTCILIEEQDIRKAAQRLADFFRNQWKD